MSHKAITVILIRAAHELSEAARSQLRAGKMPAIDLYNMCRDRKYRVFCRSTDMQEYFKKRCQVELPIYELKEASCTLPTDTLVIIVETPERSIAKAIEVQKAAKPLEQFPAICKVSQLTSATIPTTNANKGAQNMAAIQAAEDLLQKIGDSEELPSELAEETNALIPELLSIIEEGRKEYGNSNVSTSESKRFEDAKYYHEKLEMLLKKRPLAA